MAPDSPPLLRSPPFPGVAADVAEVSVARAGSGGRWCGDDGRLDRLLTQMRDARVGGAFWAGRPPFEPAAVLRPRSLREGLEMTALARVDHAGDKIFALLPRRRWAYAARARLTAAGIAATIGDVDPWAALLPAATLYAHVDDDYAVLAHIAGTTLVRADGGAPPSASAMRQALRHALLDRTTYRDPFSHRTITAEKAVAQLADWRGLLDANRGIAAAAGFAWWKRENAARFLWPGAGRKVCFTRSCKGALAKARHADGAIAVWPSRAPPQLTVRAASANVALVQVEDGFIRSRGLGANLVPPLSIVLDERGIYYDPGHASTLEHLLQNAAFSPELIERAAALTQAIVRGGLTKYGFASGAPRLSARGGKRVVLVPGQVEDDQSVRLGGAGIVGNLDLLARVRAVEPDAELWYRPHPDVEAGHRRGAISDDAALRHATRVVRGGAITDLIGQADAVHVLTSLAGFEALLRGRAVTTHGQPFYAGWGLTTDLAPPVERRTRRLTLAELVAATLILYPRYLDPVTNLPCTPEIVVQRLARQQVSGSTSWLTRARQLQGAARRSLHPGFA